MSIVEFESNEEKLNRKRNEHLALNEEFDSALKQMELRHNNGGTVSEGDINALLGMMADMTEDRRDINALAAKAGKNVSTDTAYEKALDEFLDEHL